MNVENKSKSSTNKSSFSPSIIVVIVVFCLVAAITFFIYFSKYVIVNDCASPCSPSSEVCPAVCERVTLWDSILGSIRKFTSRFDDDPPTSPQTYTIESVDLYGTVIINTHDNGSISIGYNEPVNCITYPCPEVFRSTTVVFSREGMEIVRTFLSNLPGQAVYKNMSFQDKRILIAMLNNKEEELERYVLTYYYGSGAIRYSIIESSGEITLEYENNNGKIRTNITPTDENDLIKAKTILHRYCLKEGNFNVQYHSWDRVSLSEEEHRELEQLFHLN